MNQMLEPNRRAFLATVAGAGAFGLAATALAALMNAQERENER